LTLDGLRSSRVLITGASGFLGRYVREALLKSGVPAINVLAPTHAEVDLVSAPQVVAMYEWLRPDLVIHLAARVGGIGANRAEPGRFF